MSYRVYKYTLPFMTEGVTGVMMHIGAEILTIDEQHGMLQVWAKVNPGNDLQGRYFIISGTGWDLPADTGKYIATVFNQNKTLVWHIFEKAVG